MGMADGNGPQPESLLPYEQWTEDAMRHVVAQALRHAAAKGLPGEHHFYITFRTDVPGVSLPDRLRAQYPQEMTIVLQHQFWDLALDEAQQAFSVGLSFGGVPSTLRVPLAAVTQFFDPQVRYGLRFSAGVPEPGATATPAASLPAPAPEVVPEELPPVAPDEAKAEPQVVSLDAFRRRTPPRDS
jgi:hypothetical protein